MSTKQMKMEQNRKQQPPRRMRPTFHTKDGVKLHARLIRPDDQARLIRFFFALSPESRRRRFHTDVENVESHAILRIAEAFATVDNTRIGGAVVALDGADEIVGVARIARHPATPNSADAEAAIVILDEYQGRGVGGELLHRLVVLARTMGIGTMVAEIESDNDGALRLFRRLKLPTTSELSYGTITLYIEIPPG